MSFYDWASEMSETLAGRYFLGMIVFASFFVPFVLLNFWSWWGKWEKLLSRMYNVEQRLDNLSYDRKGDLRNLTNDMEKGDSKVRNECQEMTSDKIKDIQDWILLNNSLFHPKEGLIAKAFENASGDRERFLNSEAGKLLKKMVDDLKE